jgi:hypothetical protein
VTGIFPLHKNIFSEDEFLSPCVNDRPYCQLIGPASVPSSSKDNHEEGTSAGFMKVSSEIIRNFAKAGPRNNGGRKHGKSLILTDTTEKTEIENQRAK